MKLIILIISILIEVIISATINQIDEGVNGVLIKRSGLREMRVLDVKLRLSCPPNTLGNVCADDCQNLLSCLPESIEPIVTANCAEFSSSTPYCTPGTDRCTNITDYSNSRCIAAQRTTFVCTSAGYFPDPSDCTLYHICTREFQETYQCPPEYVFDATKTRCLSRKHCKGCFTIDCSNLRNQYVHYQGQKSYYAYCNDKDITMFKCGDIDNFEFNPKTANCEFVCKSSGWFPNYENCQQYYECYKGETCSECEEKMFKRRLQTCPPNFIFDAKHRQCVEGECITNTTTSTPDWPECTTSSNNTKITTVPPPL